MGRATYSKVVRSEHRLHSEVFMALLWTLVVKATQVTLRIYIIGLFCTLTRLYKDTDWFVG